MAKKGKVSRVIGMDFSSMMDDAFGGSPGGSSSAKKLIPSEEDLEVRESSYDYGEDVQRTLAEYKSLKGRTETGSDLLTEFDLLLEDVLGRHSRRLNTALELMEDEDFYKAIKELLPYARQKLKAVDRKVKVAAKPLVVSINRGGEKQKEEKQKVKKDK